MSGRDSRATLGGRGRQNGRGRQRGGQFGVRAQFFSTNGRSALLRRPNYQDFQIGGQIAGLPRLWFRDSRGNIISPHKVREFIEEIKKYTLQNSQDICIISSNLKMLDMANHSSQNVLMTQIMFLKWRFGN